MRGVLPGSYFPRRRRDRSGVRSPKCVSGSPGTILIIGDRSRPTVRSGRLPVTVSETPEVGFLLDENPLAIPELLPIEPDDPSLRALPPWR